MWWAIASQASKGIFGAMAAYRQGREEYAIHSQNAALYGQEAESTRSSRALQRYREKKQLRTMVASQQASYSARGVSVYSGSPLDVAVHDLTEGNLDIAIADYDSEVAARRADHASQMEQYYGRLAKDNAKFKMVASLMDAGGNVAQSYAGSSGQKQAAGTGTATKTKVGQ